MSRDAMAVARAGPGPRSWRTCTIQLLQQVPVIYSAPLTTIIPGLLCNCSYSCNVKHIHTYSCSWGCSHNSSDSYIQCSGGGEGMCVLLWAFSQGLMDIECCCSCVIGSLLVCEQAWCELSRRLLTSSGCTSQSTAPCKVQAILSTGSPNLSTGKGRLELSVDRVSVCMVLLCCPSMQWV